MPYRLCPACGVTVHSVAGYATAAACPNCASPLPEAPKAFPSERRDISRRLLREPIAAAAARRELEVFRGELDQVLFEDVALLMTELIANSVKHAGPDAGDHVDVEVAVMPDRIRVDVSDGGPGFQYRGREPYADDALHWGLELLEKLSDRWEIVSGNDAPGTLVWFEVDRDSHVAA
jgi:anti-sigma regulatory factor (Ser/Thr protein kinase)